MSRSLTFARSSMGIYVKHDMSSCLEKNVPAVTESSMIESKAYAHQVHDDDSFAAAWPAVRASLALVTSSGDAESLYCS
jgi:hypothetical protein